MGRKVMSDISREITFRSAWWVPGPHAQTLWGKFARRAASLPTRVERWSTPDDDFIDVLRLDPPSHDSPRLVLLHGLEGTVRSHYVGGLLNVAYARGWGADMLIFRGCGDEPNLARRFYHSGETGDLAFAVDRILAEHSDFDLVMCGISLGGNVLLKWFGERGDSLPPRVRAAAAVSVPFDLERGSRHISRGFSKVYERHFLRTLRRKAQAKLQRYPDLFDPIALSRVRSLYEFDDVVTGPVHGFLNAHDYYSRSSSLQFLPQIRRPTFLLSARNDPFLPPTVLDEVAAIARVNSFLTIEFPDGGGHVGFVQGSPWRPCYYAERRVGEFLSSYVEVSKEAGGSRFTGSGLR